MKLENLPDGGHDKVNWKHSSDRSRDKASQQHNSETWWKRTTATLLGVSFGTYMRRCRDILKARSYVPLRRLGDVPPRRRWVFHLRLIWDVVKTYWWDVVITSPWDVVTTYQEDVVKMYHWDVVGCFIWDVPATSLGCTERRRYDSATKSCCRVSSFSWELVWILFICENLFFLWKIFWIFFICENLFRVFTCENLFF